MSDAANVSPEEIAIVFTAGEVTILLMMVDERCQQNEALKVEGRASKALLEKLTRAKCALAEQWQAHVRNAAAAERHS